MEIWEIKYVVLVWRDKERPFKSPIRTNSADGSGGVFRSWCHKDTPLSLRTETDLVKLYGGRGCLSVRVEKSHRDVKEIAWVFFGCAERYVPQYNVRIV